MSFRDARIKAGKSVSDVMAHMGVSDGAVYQWETGVFIPRGPKLVKLAEFYNCSTDELLRDNPVYVPKSERNDGKELTDGTAANP